MSSFSEKKNTTQKMDIMQTQIQNLTDKMQYINKTTIQNSKHSNVTNGYNNPVKFK